MTQEQKLQEFDREILSTKQALRFYEQKEKIVKSEIRRLTRKERTHRLCVRGGMLEHFLREPELLSDDQVYELLLAAFSHEVIAQKLNRMLDAMKEQREESFPKGKGAIIHRSR